jgi:hypothetical protein
MNHDNAAIELMNLQAERRDPACGGRGYEGWYRRRVFGGPPAQQLHSPSTQNRWLRRLHDNGHLDRDAHSGGAPAILSKMQILRMIFYLIAWPDANNSELILFLYHEYPNLVNTVKAPTISKALRGNGRLKGVRITVKKLRSIATERNEHARALYWALAPPFGINGMFLINGSNGMSACLSACLSASFYLLPITYYHYHYHQV